MWASWERDLGISLGPDAGFMGERDLGEYFPWTRCGPHRRETWVSISLGPDAGFMGERDLGISCGPDVDLTGERTG